MLIAAVLAAVQIAAGPLPQKGTDGLTVRTVRFWVPASKVTDVLGFVNVPYALATPVGQGADAFIAYNVTIRVMSADGKVLDNESWTRHAPAALRKEGGIGFEQLHFPVTAGSYLIEVAVEDSATGRVVNDTTRLVGYPSEPTASDLVVATDMRIAAEGDTTLQPGETARGPYRFTTAPVPQIDINRPNLSYMLEAYSPDSVAGELSLALTAMNGATILRIPAQTKAIPEGGGVFTGLLPLEGLPPGNYLLKASLKVAGQTVERQAEFSVADTRTVLARSVQLTNASRGIDEVFFDTQPEDSLDAEAEELVLLPGVSSRDLAPYKPDELTLTAKRRFLINFWAPRDPNKSTPVNEARVAFYAAVDYANLHYGQRNVAGWKTDRGRVYTRFGTPTDTYTNPMQGRGIPYLVWRIARGKDRWFIFGDPSGTGNWELLRSNEPTIQGMPGSLIEQLGGPGGDGSGPARDIAQWLGLDPNYFVTHP
jgi:GWxTD domain-containing protein